MRHVRTQRARQFRVWITRCEAWSPSHWSDIPPRAVALRPAQRRCLSARDAELYVEGFNRRMLATGRPWWAVAVPVAVRYEGDLAVGQELSADEVAYAD